MTLFNKALKLNGISGYKYGLPKLFIVAKKINPTTIVPMYPHHAKRAVPTIIHNLNILLASPSS